MLGIFLIYFIWKHYSELALVYNKNKRGYGFLGIATYYIGTFFAGIAIGIINSFVDTHLLDESSSSNLVLSLISMPFGLLFVWGLYKILEKKWKTNKDGDDNSLDNDLLESYNKD